MNTDESESKLKLRKFSAKIIAYSHVLRNDSNIPYFMLKVATSEHEPLTHIVLYAGIESHHPSLEINKVYDFDEFIKGNIYSVDSAGKLKHWNGYLSCASSTWNENSILHIPFNMPTTLSASGWVIQDYPDLGVYLLDSNALVIVGTIHLRQNVPFPRTGEKIELYNAHAVKLNSDQDSYIMCGKSYLKICSLQNRNRPTEISSTLKNAFLQKWGYEHIFWMYTCVQALRKTFTDNFLKSIKISELPIRFILNTVLPAVIEGMLEDGLLVEGNENRNLMGEFLSDSHQICEVIQKYNIQYKMTPVCDFKLSSCSNVDEDMNWGSGCKQNEHDILVAHLKFNSSFSQYCLSDETESLPVTFTYGSSLPDFNPKSESNIFVGWGPYAVEENFINRETRISTEKSYIIVKSFRIINKSISSKDCVSQRILVQNKTPIYHEKFTRLTFQALLLGGSTSDKKKIGKNYGDNCSKIILNLSSVDENLAYGPLLSPGNVYELCLYKSLPSVESSSSWHSYIFSEFPVTKLTNLIGITASKDKDIPSQILSSGDFYSVKQAIHEAEPKSVFSVRGFIAKRHHEVAQFAHEFIEPHNSQFGVPEKQVIVLTLQSNPTTSEHFLDEQITVFLTRQQNKLYPHGLLPGAEVILTDVAKAAGNKKAFSHSYLRSTKLTAAYVVSLNTRTNSEKDSEKWVLATSSLVSNISEIIVNQPDIRHFLISAECKKCLQLFRWGSCNYVGCVANDEPNIFASATFQLNSSLFRNVLFYVPNQLIRKFVDLPEKEWNALITLVKKVGELRYKPMFERNEEEVFFTFFCRSILRGKVVHVLQRDLGTNLQWLDKSSKEVIVHCVDLHISEET